MEDNRLENCDEFDDAFPMSIGFCQKLTEDQYEEQAETETEKALKDLLEHLDHNPDVIKALLKKRKREEEEESGFMSYMKLKMLSVIGKDIDARYTVSESECTGKIEELKDGMTKAFNYSLESKGRRCSKRIAAKKQKTSSSSENDPSIPAPPPLPPATPMSRLRTPLKDINRKDSLNTPLSVKLRKTTERRGSIDSMGTWKSIGSLRSLHDELLSIDPNKLLKSSHPRSPGGTPKKRTRGDNSPSSPWNGYSLSAATPLYKALVHGMHQKFRNVRSPSPAVPSPCQSPSGFTP